MTRGNGGTALADCTVDANHVLIFLISDDIDSNRSFAGWPVAQDQRPLAAPNGNEG
jgi:hypothetical protein